MSYEHCTERRALSKSHVSGVYMLPPYITGGVGVGA